MILGRAPAPEPLFSTGIAAVMMFACAAALAQPHGSSLYERLFGDQERAVRATPDPKDDLALAATLVEYARRTSDDGHLQRELLDHAVSLCLPRSPESPEVEAVGDLMAGVDPARKLALDEQVLELLAQRYHANTKEPRAAVAYLSRLLSRAELEKDNPVQAISYYRRALAVADAQRSANSALLRTRIERLEQRQQALQEVERLRVLVDAGDDGKRARLALLLLAEFNEPGQAAAAATGCDASRLYSLAAKAHEGVALSPADHLELAVWIESLAPSVSVGGRRVLLGHAQRSFASSIEGNTKRDGSFLEATVGLERVRAAITILPAEATVNAPLTAAMLLGGSAEFLGLTASGTRFAFILDISGSMDAGVGFGTAKRIDGLKAELGKSLEGLQPNACFFVALFSSNAVPMGGRTEWVGATDAGKAWARRTVPLIAADGATEPMPAFKMVFTLRPKPDAIYFLTDGEFNPEYANQIARLNAEYRIPIHCITFFSRDGEATMRRIAEESGGSFAHVSGAGK